MQIDIFEARVIFNDFAVIAVSVIDVQSTKNQLSKHGQTKFTQL